jgi:hypothetical protein
MWSRRGILSTGGDRRIEEAVEPDQHAVGTDGAGTGDAPPDDGVMLANPNTGGDTIRIRRSMYDPVRVAILTAVDEGALDATPLRAVDLAAQVEKRTPRRLWWDASVGWYTTSVKLDLEFRGLIEQVPTTGVQRLRITTAGRKELARLRR